MNKLNELSSIILTVFFALCISIFSFIIFGFIFGIFLVAVSMPITWYFNLL